MVLPSWVTVRASQLFFLIIVLQIPLFRAPCRSGVCSSPMEVTASQLGASQIVPEVVLKAFLFPGACLIQVMNGHSPAEVWNNLLQDYNMTDFKDPSPSDAYRLEVLAGSYFALAGAMVSLLKPGRMSMFGMLLIAWGLLKGNLFEKPQGRGVSDSGYPEPMLALALLLSVLSIKFDAAKVQRLTRPLAKPMMSSAKTKIK